MTNRRIVRVARRALLERKIKQNTINIGALNDDNTAAASPTGHIMFETIDQGDGIDERIGVEIFMKSIRAKCQVNFFITNADHDPFKQHVFLMLVKQNSNVTLTLAELFRTPQDTLMSDLKKVVARADTKNFQVLWRRILTYDPLRISNARGGEIAGAHVNYPNRGSVTYNLYIPINEKIKYTAGTGPGASAVHPYRYVLYAWQARNAFDNSSTLLTNQLSFACDQMELFYTG